MKETTSEAALARKRRKELRTSSTTSKKPRVDDSNENKSKESVVVDPVTSSDTTVPTEKPKPHITGIKKQSRYDPGVPMNREELREWRKEARKVRNRQSAAESRKRNRERITELEGEVDVLNSKYAAALQRIVELEAASAVNDSSFTPATLRQDISNLGLSKPKSVPALSPKTMPATGYKSVTPLLSHVVPLEAGQMTGGDGKHHHEEHVQKKHQHIMEMISRPIA